LEHTEPISHVAFSSDGKRMVTACGKLSMDTFLGEGSGEACLWDAATGQQLSLPLRHPQRVSHAAFNTNGLDDAALAALLGCNVAVLTPVRLCRRPGAAEPCWTWEADGVEIARRFGLDAEALGRVVEEAAGGP
jgi:hypothetical protein